MLTIAGSRRSLPIALLGSVLAFAQGCPSMEDVIGPNQDDGLNGTCSTGQFLLTDGTCHDCSSSACATGQYLGYDFNCYPSPAECPNYVPPGPVDELATADVAHTLRSIGDGLAARQAAIDELFPQVQQLIDAGDQGAQELLQHFQGAASGDQDIALSIYAYVLGRMNYTAGKGQLAQWLETNITGEVPDACSAVTQALRTMQADADLAPKDTAYYLFSEMEKTIEAVQGFSFAKRARLAKAPDAKECGREFYLIGADGMRIKDANGKDIKVGGTVTDPNVGSGLENTSEGQRKAREITDGGGTYVTGTDAVSGTTFEGYPTKRFNCAGFAFRGFIGGRRWRADPGEMLDRLTAAGLLEPIWESQAVAGDFAFFYHASGDAKSAHVAVVHAPSGLTGTTTVINADGYSGLFTAPLNCTYFNDNYQDIQFYRWKNGAQPTLEVSTDRSQANSCFGEDSDDDGWPDSTGCVLSRCIDSEFLPGYRVYMADMYSGQLEVMEKGAENRQLPACNFSGGGLDCSVYIQVSPVTEVFPTSEEAVLSICPRVANLKVLPLGVGPGCDFDGSPVYTSWEVYSTLLTCP